MSKYLVDSADMTDIADAIRSKTGSSNTMTVADMPTQIASIPSTGLDYLAQRVQGTLTSYNIPNTCTQISTGAFGGLSSLQSVTIPSSIIRIGYSSFAYTTNLRLLTIPDSVTRIEDYAFQESGIERVDLSRLNLSYLGAYAFINCPNLAQVILPTIVNIPEYAFYRCENLTTINFVSPTSLKSVGPYAFYGTSLEGDFEAGNEFTFNIGSFYNLSSEHKLKIHFRAINDVANKYTIPDNTFDEDICELVVPRGRLSVYQNAFDYYDNLFTEESN